MKRRIISLLVVSSLIFVFIVFYKGLNKPSFYKPKSEISKIPKFFAKNFYSDEEIDSKKIFDEDKYYLFNIWASWCVPCKDEHPILSKLSKNKRYRLNCTTLKNKNIY